MNLCAPHHQAEIAVTPPHWPFAHVSSEDQTQVLPLKQQDPSPYELCPLLSPASALGNLAELLEHCCLLSARLLHKTFSTFSITSSTMVISFPSMGDIESIKLNRTLRNIIKRLSTRAILTHMAGHPHNSLCYCQRKPARSQKSVVHPMGED